jgi:cellobiose dehydrogenase (acceptor)
MYTEPNTNMTFYTSVEKDGAVSSGFSTSSVGGFTYGIALPPSAVTKDSYDYIGLIVSLSSNV